MTHSEAVQLISGVRQDTRQEPATWADLGCGDGTFTLALAALLPAGSTIHAVDREAAVLRGLPDAFQGSRILPHLVDFARQRLPFERLDGILMANSLHYVANQDTFVRGCASYLDARHRFLIVEYDLRRRNSWVPYPLDQAAAGHLFRKAGYASVSIVGTRPSRYQRGSIYALLAESTPESAT